MGEKLDGHKQSGAAEEASLIARLRAGDGDAFEELVRTHGGRMLAVTRRYLENDADARDALQDAFLSVFKALDRFEGGSQLSTWLHRIAVNAALMKIRTRQRKPETSIEDLLPAFLEGGHHAQPVPSWGEAADHKIERAQTRRLIRESIDKLPESYRNVMLLRDIEEFDTAETAKMLGITPNAVKIRLHRARQALRGLLDPHMVEGSP